MSGQHLFSPNNINILSNGKLLRINSTGINFSYLEGHASFQTSILIGHFTKLGGHPPFCLRPNSLAYMTRYGKQSLEGNFKYIEINGKNSIKTYF